jgi:tRNA threonylcarbamoyladenosine modification (KEOPS) complex Cgi121 subunit
MVRTSMIKGSSYSASIGGFRGVRVGDLEAFLSRLGKTAEPAVFQVFDAGMVAGWRHLFFAAVNAVRSYESGSTISRSLGIEAFLHASCQDQISRAFEFMGVSEDSERVALLVLAEDPGAAEEAYEKVASLLGKEDDSVLEVSGEKFASIVEAFGISHAELEAVGGPLEEALGRAIVERGALLGLRR